MGTLLGAVSAMAESAEWEAALDRNGWSAAYLDGDAFAQFLEAEWSRTEETLTAIGLR
jgi:putative tricarboxylic transport membrane protein